MSTDATDRNGSVVFLGHYCEQVRSTVLPICTELNASSSLSALVVVEDDPGGEIRRMCEAVGVRFIHRGRQSCGGEKAAEKSSAATPSGPPPVRQMRHENFLRRKSHLLRQYLKGRGREVAARLSIARRARFLRRVGTAVLVVPDNRTVASMRWLAASRKDGIPTMLNQWAAFHQASTYAKLRAAHPSGQYTSDLADPVSEAIARRVPGASVVIAERRVWFLDPAASLLYDRLGVFPYPRAFTFGSGATDVTTLFGQAWKRRLSAEGVAESRLAVTGHPDQDRWHRLLQTDKIAARARLASTIAAPPERSVLTIIAPALQFRDGNACRAGEISADQLLCDVGKVVQQMRAVAPAAEIIVKAHPRDSVSRLASLRTFDSGVKIVADVPTDLLVRCSEVVACQWSTVAMTCLAVQTPLVLFDFHRTESAEVYEGILDLPVAASPDALRQEVFQLLNVPAYRRRRMSKQGELARDCLQVDGQATTRILHLVLQLAGSETDA